MQASRSPSPTLKPEPHRVTDGIFRTTTSTSSSDEEREERAAENTDDLRPAEGPGSRPAVPEKFAHTIFDPKIAHLRKIYTKIILGTLVLTVIIMWICLPVYWGSLARSNTHAPSLKAWVMDRDGGEIGQTVVQGLLATTKSGTKQHLGWIQVPGDHVNNVGDAVVDEQAWGAVVINPGASAALAAARATGNSSYNPMSAITFYYAQARNEQATGSYVNPLTVQALTQILQQYNARSASSYLVSISNNSTALQAVTSAPQTLTSGVWWTTENLRPYNAPVATALTLVGQIYLCIFAFILTMSNDAARGILGPFLRLKSYLMLRLAVPLIVYIPLSFSFAMVSLPFHAPFGAKYTYGGGFFLYFAYTYMGMAALGLATEAMVTLLTPRFMAFFLLPLIISNVSVTSLPFDLQPWFYQYGHAFPVFNNSQAVRTILFNTKNHLGLNAGVIIGWIALSCVTIPLFTMFMRRRDEREHEKQVREKNNNEKRV
ncbi:Nitrosoguanidine resistance protein SNG1 OS=Saccharomyces cerevisiae (strain ATCC 204508 / S288c) GN=SNG1 PE=1 SV=1 [Rhizoctonia solani AG-1 IB]|uniref:Nitrosoguanidine resistance protein SNG1 n=1 Tax=Thanatephorus cucumeris (strain AG1-IB / isolate 7/3/14) TaxID=1108050 RepID=M5BUZ8_THACB|nr:Nitrosoguanidine resistance protein SNG1 [Rhizoctonia solani AG-1 IB]CEL60194.1 Nitrosoguanidine resistance protein SNG1 OS=Saccharomyces cerevisiae (strain ATCC 204508 / S288c) GN=SNG1 PE=1 SV=1 [Rhizoctonia solani AG-1 IB]